jgi:hypothetical protein
MGYYLGDYRARVGTWAARSTARGSKGQEIGDIMDTLLCAAVLTVLLVIGGVEQNAGPGVDTENILHVLCSGCDKSKIWNTMRHMWTLVSQQLWKR